MVSVVKDVIVENGKAKVVNFTLDQHTEEFRLTPQQIDSPIRKRFTLGIPFFHG